MATAAKTGMVLVALAALCLGIPAAALPRRAPASSTSPPATPGAFIGEASGDLAVLMLQGLSESPRNLAFSPLGYSALLALLAEGAQGETRQQLATALHLPADAATTRAAYREVLLRLREKNVVNKPELRTWFYVYKNQSVEPAYRDILKEYYLTEVKSVARPTEALGFSPLGETEQPPTQEQPQTLQQTLHQQQTLQPQTLQPQTQQQQAQEAAGAALEEAMTLGAMKEGALIETALQEEQTRLIAEQKKKEQKQKEQVQADAIEHLRDPLTPAAQQPEDVILVKDEAKDEKMQGDEIPLKEQTPVETPVVEQIQDDQVPIKEQIIDDQKEQMQDEQNPMKEQMKDDQKPTNERIQDGQTPLKEQMQGEPIPLTEQMQHNQAPIMEQLQDEQSPMQEQVQEEQRPVEDQMPAEDASQQQVQGEVMQVSERRTKREQRGAEAEAGAAAGLAPAVGAGAPADGALAGGGLSGNLLSIKGNDGSPSATRMLLFNGMYFRGSWASPPEALAQPLPFGVAGRAAPARMMAARGDLRMRHVRELNADAVELPYEGGRYALLLLVPREGNADADEADKEAQGSALRALVADLAGFSLTALARSLRPRNAEVVMPCFAIETITRPIPTFKKAGLGAVFSAGEADLSGVAAGSGLYVQDLVQLVTLRVDDAYSTANHMTSSALEARTEPQERVIVDRPFLYFVRDVEDGIVMVAGKVEDPNEKPSPYA